MKTHSFARISIFIYLLTLSNLLLSQQKPNSKNYYDFYSNDMDLTTMWLDKETIAAVAKEEMAKMGFERLAEYRIVKIDSGVYVVAICYSEKEKFGFLYEGTHLFSPKEANREVISLNKSQSGFEYTEKIVDINGKSEFVKIKNLPPNLFILKADIYWYQETNSPQDNRPLVTKEIIIKILRKDIKTILKSIK